MIALAGFQGLVDDARVRVNSARLVPMDPFPGTDWPHSAGFVRISLRAVVRTAGFGQIGTNVHVSGVSRSGSSPISTILHVFGVTAGTVRTVREVFGRVEIRPYVRGLVLALGAVEAVEAVKER